MQISHDTVEDTDNRDLFTTDVALKDGTVHEVSTEFALFLVRNAFENHEWRDVEGELSPAVERSLKMLEGFFELARKGEY